MKAEKKMVAFHGDPKIKQKYLDRVAAHRAADELVRGTGWDGQRGCAVGCTLHAYNHEAYETELGIPQMLARLEDGIFERLPIDLATDWPRRFLAAPKPGADLSLVGWKFLYWLVADTLDEHGTPDVRTGCAKALVVLRLKSTGKPVTADAADSARAAAYATNAAADAANAAANAAFAAFAASRAAANAAARAAAYAAANAARAAAYAANAARAAAYATNAAADAANAAANAANAAAKAAANAAAYIRMADKLEELMKEAK